jgi:hypothetical protein
VVTQYGDAQVDDVLSTFGECVRACVDTLHSCLRAYGASSHSSRGLKRPGALRDDMRCDQCVSQFTVVCTANSRIDCQWHDVRGIEFVSDSSHDAPPQLDTLAC